MDPEKVFLEVAKKLLELTFGDWSGAEGASLGGGGGQPLAGSRGRAPVGVLGE